MARSGTDLARYLHKHQWRVNPGKEGFA